MKLIIAQMMVLAIRSSSTQPIRIPLAVESYDRMTVAVRDSHPHLIQLTPDSYSDDPTHRYRAASYSQVHISLLTESNTWFEYESYNHHLSNFGNGRSSIGIAPGSSLVTQFGSTSLVRWVNQTSGEGAAALVTGANESEFVSHFCVAGSSMSIPVQYVRYFGYTLAVVGAQVSILAGHHSTPIRAIISANRQLMRLPVALLQQIHGYMEGNLSLDHTTMAPHFTNCTAIRATLPVISISFTNESNSILGIFVVHPEEYTRPANNAWDNDRCELLITSSGGADMFINLLMIPDINIRSGNRQIMICDSLDF
jgi:hypothetical protein